MFNRRNRKSISVSAKENQVLNYLGMQREFLHAMSRSDNLTDHQRYLIGQAREINKDLYEMFVD